MQLVHAQKAVYVAYISAHKRPNFWRRVMVPTSLATRARAWSGSVSERTFKIAEQSFDDAR